MWWLILSVSVGCGYQFTVEGPGPVIGGATSSVAQGPPVRMVLSTLKNNSFEPNLEFKYTRYLRQAMESAGSAEFVDEDASADFILEGAIVSVSLPSVAFTRTQTQESRVMVSVAVTVRDRNTGKILWTQTASSTAEFFVGATSTTDASSGLQFNRVLQDRALEQAGQMVAADLADRFLGASDQGTFQMNKGKRVSDPALEKSESSDIPDLQGEHVPAASVIN